MHLVLLLVATDLRSTTAQGCDPSASRTDCGRRTHGSVCSTASCDVARHIFPPPIVVPVKIMSPIYNEHNMRMLQFRRRFFPLNSVCKSYFNLFFISQVIIIASCSSNYPLFCTYIRIIIDYNYISRQAVEAEIFSAIHSPLSTLY